MSAGRGSPPGRPCAATTASTGCSRTRRPGSCRRRRPSMPAGRRTSSPARRRSSPRSKPRADRCSSRAEATRGRCSLARGLSLLHRRVVCRWYPEPMDSPDLKAPQQYINRELSFLEFNQRVLDQAFDESVPLLERLKFLCISCSNLDEFFEIRVAGLKQLQELGGGQLAPDGMSIPEQLTAIHDRATRLVADQYRCLNSLLLPALAAEGGPLLEPAERTPHHSEWLAAVQ